MGSGLFGCDDAILGLLAADVSELHIAFVFKGSLVYNDETDGLMFVRNVMAHGPVANHDAVERARHS